MKNFVIGVLVVTTIASLIGSGLLFERYSTSRPLVKVGTDVITKKQYEDAVDYQTQGSVLKKLVFSALVQQAAAKAGVLPSEKDVDGRIAELRRRSPQALADVNGNPAKMADLRDNLKLDIALDSLRSQGIAVTDEEVADFYAKHKQSFALPAQVSTTLIVTDNAVDAATASSLLKQNHEVHYDKVAKEYVPVLDVIARQPRLHIAGMNGFTPDFQLLSPEQNQAISRQVYAMKAGDVRTILIGRQYLIIKANELRPATTPSLSDIRPEVARAAQLEKAPSAQVELAKLYQNANIEFEVGKYSNYFTDVQNMPVSNDDTKKTASLP